VNFGELEQFVDGAPFDKPDNKLLQHCGLGWRPKVDLIRLTEAVSCGWN
jgi:hypothetical protein